MILIQCGEEEVRYYSLVEASNLITKDLAGKDVSGLHSETLRRTHRQRQCTANTCTRAHGRRIGRDVFFSKTDIEAMGYTMKEPDPNQYLDMGEIIQLFPMEENVNGK